MGILSSIRAGLRKELEPMLRLAGPVVIAELGWMMMAVVDTLMVGRLGPEAIGAVSVGSVLFYTVGVFGTGMLLGLDTLIPQAVGAGDLGDCHHSLIQAIYGIVLLGPALMAPMFLLIPALPRLGLNPDVAALTGPFANALLWSAVPLLVYMAFRQYLQAMNKVKAITVTMISANLVNVAANWVFIYGNLGMPAYGVAGAGWASCASRVYMCFALGGYLLWDAHHRRTGLFHTSKALDWTRLKRLLQLGLPAAVQRALEVGVFAMATILIGRLDAASLAAHQVALNVASVTFMVPLGISSAAAVRVGQALGRRDPDWAYLSGWTALGLGGAFMTFAGLVFLAIPEAIVRLYSADPDVVRMGVQMLYIAAVFQLFDGFQVVATGALRGGGDTRTPMIMNLIGHWLLGLPIGWWLCFRTGMGAAGIWMGLSIGLTVVGAALAYSWSSRREQFRALTAAETAAFREALDASTRLRS